MSLLKLDRPTLLTLLFGTLLLGIGVAGIRIASEVYWIRFFDNMHWTIGYLFGASLAWIGYQHAEAAYKNTVFWFALGLSAYSVGQILWDIQVYIDWNPFPGPSDAFFLLLGLFCSIGLLKACFAPLSTTKKQTASLDISALVIATLSLTLALYLDKRGNATYWQLAVMVAYPVFLLTAACVTAILVPALRLRPHPSWIIFSIGLAGSGFAWLKWNSMTLDGALTDGTWYNTLFSFAAVLMGLGARYWRLESSPNPSWDRSSEFFLRLLPLMVVIGAAASVIYTVEEKTLPSEVANSIQLGAIAVIILAMMRQSLSLKERDQLLAAEKAMHESETKLQELMASTSDCIFSVKKVEGQFWFDEINNAAAAILGYERSQLLAEPIIKVLGAELAQPLFVNYERCFSTGQALNYERQFTTSDGPIWFDTALIPIRDEGSNTITLVFGVARDITTRRQEEAAIVLMNQRLEEGVKQRTLELNEKNQALEETLQHLSLAQEELVNSEKLASLGALVAGISHELNTPIGNCITVASTLDDIIKNVQPLTPASSAGFLEDVQEANQLLNRNLRKAIDLISSFKQVAVDQASAQRRTFDLAEVVREVIQLQQVALKHKAIHIETRLEEGLVLNSYPGPLGQILQNLMANACLHGFEGKTEGTITITAQRLDQATIKLSVADDGNGIAAAILPKIFDPFFTTKLGHGGSGLGLNIVHNIANRILGGKITVQSTEGMGACFEIILPVEAPAAEAE